jgi:hypothetical protein
MTRDPTASSSISLSVPAGNSHRVARGLLVPAEAVVVGAFAILFDPIFQGLALSLMFGEVASTFLSRVTAPVLYYMSEKRKHVPGPLRPEAEEESQGRTGGTGENDPPPPNATASRFTEGDPAPPMLPGARRSSSCRGPRRRSPAWSPASRNMPAPARTSPA